MADDTSASHRLAGHVRIGPDGIEFAADYLDWALPRSLVTSALTRSMTPGRGWMHVVATGKRVTPFQITPCTCGPRGLPPPERRVPPR